MWALLFLAGCPKEIPVEAPLEVAQAPTEVDELGIGKVDGGYLVPRAALLHAWKDMPTVEPVGSVEEGVTGFRLLELGWFERLGLVSGEVLTAADDVPIRGDQDLLAAVESLFTREVTHWTVLQDGEARALRLEMEGSPVELPARLDVVIDYNRAVLPVLGYERTDEGWRIPREATSVLLDQAMVVDDAALTGQSVSIFKDVERFGPLLGVVRTDSVVGMDGVIGDSGDVLWAWMYGMMTADEVVLHLKDGGRRTLEMVGEPLDVPAHWPGVEESWGHSDNWLRMGLERTEDGIRMPRAALLHLIDDSMYLKPVRGHTDVLFGYRAGGSKFFDTMGIVGAITHIDGVLLDSDEQAVAAVLALFERERITYVSQLGIETHQTVVTIDGPPIPVPEGWSCDVSLSTEEERVRAGVQWTEAGASLLRSALGFLAETDATLAYRVKDGEPVQARAALGKLARLLDLPNDAVLVRVDGAEVRGVPDVHAARQVLLSADTVVLHLESAGEADTFEVQLR